MTTSHLAIVIPVFNEAQVLPRTLSELLETVARTNAARRVELILVDDGSTDSAIADLERDWLATLGPAKGSAIHVLRLNCNQGHQRAILAGLRYAVGLPWDACLVMDADGQDDPVGIDPMLAALAGQKDMVFARRSSRGEGLLWRFGYGAYQLAFRALLGQSLPLGNFCVLRRNVVQRLCQEGDLTHLAATLSSYGFRRAEVAIGRRQRAAGQSKMSLWHLVDYGVSAMTASVQAWTRLFTRLAFLMAGLSLTGFAAVVGIRLGTSLAISGWASTICLLTLGISIQAVGFMVMTAFLRRILSQLSPTQLTSTVQVFKVPDVAIAK